MHDCVRIQRHVVQDLRPDIVDRIADQIQYDQLERKISHRVLTEFSLKITHFIPLRFKSFSVILSSLYLNVNETLPDANPLLFCNT